MIFLDSGSVAFFYWLKPGGPNTKNGTLMDQVCFVYQALFNLMKSVKTSVQNTVNMRVVVSAHAFTRGTKFSPPAGKEKFCCPNMLSPVLFAGMTPVARYVCRPSDRDVNWRPRLLQGESGI